MGNIYLTPHAPAIDSGGIPDADSRLDAGAPDVIPYDPVEVLAAHLRDKMEHLDPTETGDLDWWSLSERDRNFYKMCVQDLIESPEALDAIRRHNSHHHRIDRHGEKSE
jgi:hypothetical protein